MPEESRRCLESSHHGHGMAVGALLEGPPWNSPPRAGHCFFKGQSVQLCNLLCKKGMIYLHPGLERKAGYMFNFQMVPNLPDEDYVDLTQFRTTVHFPLCSPSLRLPPHFLEAGIWPWNHDCSCVSDTHSSHLHTTSICFCKLWKRAPGPEVPTPNHGLGRRARLQRKREEEISRLLFWLSIPCLSFWYRLLFSYSELMMTRSV